jgi:hypothetical protein
MLGKPYAELLGFGFEVGQFMESGWQRLLVSLVGRDPKELNELRRSRFNPEDFNSNAIGPGLFYDRERPLPKQLRKFFELRYERYLAEFWQKPDPSIPRVPSDPSE